MKLCRWTKAGERSSEWREKKEKNRKRIRKSAAADGTFGKTCRSALTLQLSGSTHHCRGLTAVGLEWEAKATMTLLDNCTSDLIWPNTSASPHSDAEAVTHFNSLASSAVGLRSLAQQSQPLMALDSIRPKPECLPDAQRNQKTAGSDGDEDREDCLPGCCAGLLSP